jgi:HSP20 family protein
MLSGVARRDIDRLQDEIQELFADLWQVPRFAGLRRGLRPEVDCYQTEDPPRLIVVVEVAGVDPERIQIMATADSLVVSGERRRAKDPGRVYQQAEIEYGPFERRVALTEAVDPSDATATYNRGLLTVTLPLATQPARTVRVAIDVSARP